MGGEGRIVCEVRNISEMWGDGKCWWNMISLEYHCVGSMWMRHWLLELYVLATSKVI